ncbi:response regulator transcription factor [Zobellia laminariae]|uniref:response regulator transcription factor n=1 Tax=Zobellia laminariae TaxID=248906 RepID=UPI0034CD25F2
MNNAFYRHPKLNFNIKLLNMGDIRKSERGLTKREIEILRLITEGFSSKQIAEQLFISYNTVRTHRNNILKNSAFKTIPEVICSSIRAGIL